MDGGHTRGFRPLIDPPVPKGGLALTGSIALRSYREPGAIVLVISGQVVRTGVPGLVRRACALLEGCDAEVIVCDVGQVVDPDAVALDALARLQLAARRSGRTVVLRHAADELKHLVSFSGLADVVPCNEAELLVEPKRQSEEREDPGGIQEERDPGDPIAR